MKPSICVACIAKQEFRDLPRMLASVKDIADKVVIVDTGSVDGTLIVSKLILGDKLIHQSYLDASDKDGRLMNFSQARNRALELADHSGCTHVLMLDADDELLTPKIVQRGIYWTQIDAFGTWIEDGVARWVTHRLWKTGKGIKYIGRCHEYPKIDGLASTILGDAVIRHRGDPGTNQEDNNARNLRMMMMAWNEDGHDTRTAFYIANTHRDAERWPEAVEWYRRRIELGEGYRDEYLFAHLYLARALRAQMLEEQASKVLHQALQQAPDWCEFTMELAKQRYDHSLFEDAIKLAQNCCDASVPYTALWREYNCYRDGPPRLISWAYEQLGKMTDAYAWAEIAATRIGTVDREWDARRQRLRNLMNPAKKAEKPKIALVRPGAIGDILMTLNLIPALKAKYPDRDIDYFCDAKLGAPDALGTIMKQAGVDHIYGLENKSGYERVINLVGYPLQEGYPEKPMQRHLISYFATEMGLDPDAEYVLTLLKSEQPLWADDIPDRYVTFQSSAGWSKYKCWFEDHWQKVIRQFSYQEMPILWIDECEKRTLADSISLFANARMHIGIDSFCNHLTHYLWTDQDMNTRRVPGVILFGSTSPVGSGYEHNTNIYKGLGCQPCYRENPKISKQAREPCVNPPRANYEDNTPWSCMNEISVDEVVAAVRQMWEKVK